VTIVLSAYLLAGLPIAFVVLAGWMSPIYRQPWKRVAPWWSWCALMLVASAFVFVLLGQSLAVLAPAPSRELPALRLSRG
jgi:hypothetical protein